MPDDLYELGRTVLGMERPPAGVRHFLPLVDHEAMLNPPQLDGAFESEFGFAWRVGYLFDGYSPANLLRYIQTRSAGECLAPDIPPVSIGLYDPALSVRPGDVGLIEIALPDVSSYAMGKHIQMRDGRLWACCNDGDIPVSEQVNLIGRLVALLLPQAVLDSSAISGWQNAVTTLAMDSCT